MSPVVGYHCTRRCCRDSIRENGLIPSRPTRLHPCGVFVFTDTDEFDHPTYKGCSRWDCYPRGDLWEVVYIGPMTPDCFVVNGMILLEWVMPTEVTLVTGN